MSFKKLNGKRIHSEKQLPNGIRIVIDGTIEKNDVKNDTVLVKTKLNDGVNNLIPFHRSKIIKIIK